MAEHGLDDDAEALLRAILERAAPEWRSELERALRRGPLPIFGSSDPELVRLVKAYHARVG